MRDRSSIFLLHLSDLHINPSDTAASAPVYRDLCEKLRKFRGEKEAAFDLVFISGDLVNQGATEYEAVRGVITTILEASGATPDRLFVVPGNHDVCRSACTGMHRHVVSSLKRDPKEFDRLEGGSRLELARGFEAYSRFVEKYPLHSSGQFAVPGFAQADLEVSGVPVRLCGLNSALVAGPDDANKGDNRLRNRVVGTQLVRKMLDTDDRLNVVLSHYPLSWLHPGEQKEVRERLGAANAIFFHGHTHAPDKDIEGVVENHQMLVIGVGSLYGQKWHGRNHCQVLELSFGRPWPLLHEWFWWSAYGWRGFEPLEIAWSGWQNAKKKMRNPRRVRQSPLFQATSEKLFENKTEGLVDFGRGRKEEERMAYYQKAINSAADGTDFIALGRSLIDLSLLSGSIQAAISQRKVNVKLGLIDENTILNRQKGMGYESWIEKPVPKDWAIEDIPGSMLRFRSIEVPPDTGSLEIYGLPFYLTHSFVAYTSKLDGFRYCLEETGMALSKHNRPFVELKAASPDGFAPSLESVYRGVLTADRLLVRLGPNAIERDTTKRAKIIVPKVERFGLVDLGSRTDIDWYGGDLSEKIRDTPDGGEIFIVGRSLVAWTNYYKELAEAIIGRGLRCIFVMADPTKPDLKSLVADEYAETDVPVCWKHFRENLYPLLEKRKTEKSGLFELYGIPAYVPGTFASYERCTKHGNEKYCTLEPGIGVGPTERAILYFMKVSDKDMYTRLYRIYRGIVEGRTPLLRFPSP